MGKCPFLNASILSCAEQVSWQPAETHDGEFSLPLQISVGDEGDPILALAQAVTFHTGNENAASVVFPTPLISARCS